MLNKAASSFFGGVIECSSRMTGNCQVRFLEGWPPAMGAGHSAVRAAAQLDVGTDRSGSLAGQGMGKEAESERTIATRFVVESRTKVDDARTKVDPGGLADNNIHRIVRVTAE
jgi:hypothetical protein